jgi:hypothetical protein
VLTIVYLTLKEALRRRAPLISVLVAALMVVPAFIPLAGKLLVLPPPVAHQIYAAIYTSVATDMVKFFASVLAVSLGAGAISAEIERGTLSSILPKPITRFSVYAGKWLGLFLFLALNVVAWDAVIWGVATYRNPEASHASIWHTLPVLLLYPAVFTSLALAFSAFASFPLAAGLSILAAGLGWAEGALYVFWRLFDIEMLRTLSAIAGYVFPLGRMSRLVTEALALPTAPGGQEIGRPRMFEDLTVQPGDLTFVVAYGLLLFVVGAVVLGRRDV